MEKGYVEMAPGPFQKFFGAPHEDSVYGLWWTYEGELPRRSYGDAAGGGQCVGSARGASLAASLKQRIHGALDEILSFCSAVFGKGKSHGLNNQGLYDALRIEAIIIEL